MEFGVGKGLGWYKDLSLSSQVGEGGWPNLEDRDRAGQDRTGRLTVIA